MAAPEKNNGPLFLVALLLFYYVLMAMLVPTAHIIRVQVAERELLRTYLGESSMRSIVHRSDTLFLKWFIDSGVAAESYDMFLPTRQAQERSRGMEQLGEREGFFVKAREKIDAFWALVRFSIQRFIAILIWMPLLMVLMVAAIWDGWMRRRIKMIGFEQTSAPIFGLARQAFILGIFAPLFYVFAPVVIHPVITPLWGCYMAFALLLKASNLQRI